MPAGMKKWLRYYHTVKYLKFIQIVGRVWFKLYQPKPDFSPAPQVRPAEHCWTEAIMKAVSVTSSWSFSFLNQTRSCHFPDDWNNNEINKLWLYNLHYFDCLNSDPLDSQHQLHRKLIQCWIDDNPAALGNGWESYPLSLRIVNWIKWALRDNELDANASNSLAGQVRHLRKRLEVHLLGNHLLANAKALVYAGLYFSGKEADSWLDKGLHLINRELLEQILADGGHFERSPMYHAIILEDLLDIINISTVYGRKIPRKWLDIAGQMLHWLLLMSHPDGKISLFNDSAFGVAAEPAKLIDYATRLQIDVPVADSRVRYLASSGYVTWRQDDVTAFLDVGLIGPDYLPAHAHADTLSFELSLYSQRVVVDSGVSCYGLSAERQWQRSTAAHNTVEIDGYDSSEVWGNFRVGRRARPMDLKIESNNGSTMVSCGHTGYKRLSGKPVHLRVWIFAGRTLQIRDTIQGEFGQAISRFYFHPDVKLTIDEKGDSGYIRLADGKAMTWNIKGGSGTVQISSYSPEFGVSLENSHLEVTFAGKVCEILFSW